MSDRNTAATGRGRALLLALTLVSALMVAAPSSVGADANEAPGAPLPYRNLTAGTSHSCGIVADGRLKCWGLNDQGQLGQGTTDSLGDAATEMGAGLPAIDLGAGHTAVAVAVGDAHTCALLEDHTVRCWGEASRGRLGRPLAAPVGDEPGELGDALTAVDLGTGQTATALTAAGEHTCALLADGRVKCWGSGPFGQLGTGDLQPRGDDPGEMGDALRAVPLARPAVAISTGTLHTCALLDDGRVSCWGYGGARGGVADFGIVPLGAGHAAIALSAGGGHTCAILDDHTLKCWGAGGFGQLGQGSTATLVTFPGSSATH